MKSLRETIQMKASEQCFSVMLFIMLYKVVLTFESVGETETVYGVNTSKNCYGAVLFTILWNNK